MGELQLAQDLVTSLLMMAVTAIWPPVGTGAFWIMIGVYGLVSIFFDDETPRGVPGIEYLRRSDEQLSKSRT